MKTIKWIIPCLAVLTSFWAFVVPTPISKLDFTASGKFKQFLHQFPAGELPFALELDDLLPADLNEQSPGLKSLDDDPKKGMTKAEYARYMAEQAEDKEPKTIKEHKKAEQRRELMAEFIPEAERRRFSRIGPPEIIPVERVELNENLMAVIYETHHYFFDFGKTVKMAV